MNKLIEIKDLTVNFYTYEGVVRAITDLDLDIYQGETLGLVGETGCGKTVASLSILRLVLPPGKIESGQIMFYTDDHTLDLLSISERKIRAIRGSLISMVFQEPGAALNPVYTIGDQITEVILLHRKRDLANRALEILEPQLEEDGRWARVLKPFRRWQQRLYQRMREDPNDRWIHYVKRTPVLRHMFRRMEKEAEKIAVSLLKEVEIADPHRVIKQHPHQLSGGMKQRAVIAMALACRTRLLIADEPTTALDVTIQAQILELLKKLKDEIQTSILYITHDLAVAAEICDRVAVMYSGSLCEIADVVEIFQQPLHPYTRALMAAVPKPGEKPAAIKGFVPDPLDLPPGCRFHPRCQQAMDICKTQEPPLVEVAPGHYVACHLYPGGQVEDAG